jgi:DNA modification methylase
MTVLSMGSSELDTLQAAFRAAGGHWSTFIIWAKHTFTLGQSDYQRQYEPILYGWPEGVQRHWCGDRDQGDV